MMTFREKKILGISVFMAGVSLLLQLLARNVAGFADWYVSSVYVFFVGLLGRLSSLAPVSVAELLLTTAVIFLLYGLFWYGRHLLHRQLSIRQLLKKAGISMTFTGSVLFCLYTLNCGINYHHTDFASAAGLSDGEYTTEELVFLCRYFLEQTNLLSREIRLDETGLCQVGNEVNEEAVRAMSYMGSLYPGLSGYYPLPKGLINAEILSYQQLTGIYSPFTIEANYNSDMPDFYKPFTLCHELAHVKGYMKEEEANYIAILACLNADSEAFRYSGSLMAWVYCSNALYKSDPIRYASLKEELSDTASRELANNTGFWNRYKGAAAEISHKVNDAYLKVNAQSDGVKSYGRVVDLLLAGFYQETRPDETLVAGTR